jgi:hypothetical protein
MDYRVFYMKRLAKAFPYALVCLMAFLACIVPVLRDGWPYNHDGDAVFKCLTIFKEQVYGFHDYFPTWTAYGSYGLGSPQPFFYHHLYFYIVSSIDLLFNDVLLSVKFSVFLFLSLGGIALYMTVKNLFQDRYYGIIGAGLFIFSSYIYTQWLIRGDQSEFLASIVFVWILFIFSRLSHRFSAPDFLAAGFLFSILMYAHSLIFMFAPFVFIIFLFAHTSDWMKNPFKPALAFISPSILCLPYIIVFLAVKKLFNMDFPVVQIPVKDRFIEIYRYFFDNHYNMGEAFENYSVEIGRFFVIPLLILIAVMLARKKQLPPFWPGPDNRALGNYMIFVFIALVFYIILQLPVTTPFYYSLEFLKFLQFPWRLLCLITPLAVILFIYYSDAVKALFTKINGRKAVKTGMALILAIQAIWVGGNYEFYKYKAFSGADIKKIISGENLLAHFTWEEYFPAGFKKKAVSSVLENRGLNIISLNDPALLSSVRDFESIHIVLAPGGGTLVFNQIRSPFITLKFSSNINAAGGDYQETVFSQSNDGQGAYIDISKTGLIGLDLYSIEKLFKKGKP